MTALAGIIERIADSDVGTPLIVLASGIALVNRALATSALAKNSLVADLLLGKSLDGGGRGLNAFQRTGTGLQSLSGRARAASTDLKTLATSYATAGARSERETARIGAASGRLRSSLGPVGKTAGLVAGLALATSGLSDSFGLANTTSLALAGTIGGPWGAAFGAGVGLLLDAKHATDEAAKSQAAYQRVVAGDNPAPIRKRVNELESQGYSRDTPTKVTPAVFAGRGAGYTQAVAQAKGADLLTQSYAALDRIGALSNTKVGAVNAKLLGDGLILTAHGAELATESTDKFTAELGVLNTALAARSSLTSYRSALLDIGDALKKNGPTLNLNTREGLANRQSLEALASTALARAKDLEDAGKRTQSIKFLSNAKKDLIDAAVAFGVPRKQARALANQLLDLDAVNAKPTVTLVDQATGKISGIRGHLLALDGTHATTYIDTVLGNSGSGTGGPKKHAAGGSIAGPGWNDDTEGALAA